MGSIQPVTAESVQDAERGSTASQTLWVVGIVLFWVLVLGLPTLAIALTVRRRRARRTSAAPGAPAQAAAQPPAHTPPGTHSPEPPPLPRI